MATTQTAAPVAHSDAIPAVVRRNTLLLALSQALTGAGTQLPYALGSLMSVALVGSLAWTGLAVSIMGASKFFVSYPLGQITDRYGRKPGFQLGLALGLVGTVGVGLAMQLNSVVAFVIALLVFGMGMSASLQLRVAAADMYPPSRRAEGIGWVLTGTMLGVFGAPMLVVAADHLGPAWGLEPLALSWLLVPIIILPCMLCIALVRPDPRDIALNLDKYYPGSEPAPRWDATPRTSVLTFLRHYPKRAAFLANLGGYGSMSIVMVLATLALAHEGHGLAAISLSQSAHTTGMFGLSMPLGWLADRLGRRAVVVPGILVELLGVLLVVLTHDFWSITLGGFLVGAGWSAINVATTAMLADVSEPVERGQAVGANDTVGSIASVTMPLLVGPMTALWGAGSTSWLALGLMSVPLVLFLRIHEPSPGQYRYPGSGD